MSDGKKDGGGKSNGGRGRNEWVELLRELLPALFLSGGGFLKSCSVRGCLLTLMVLAALMIPGGWIFWVVFGTQGRIPGITMMIGGVLGLVLLVYLFSLTSKIQDVEILQEALAGQVLFAQPEPARQPDRQITAYDEGGEEIARPREIEDKQVPDREIDV